MRLRESIILLTISVCLISGCTSDQGTPTDNVPAISGRLLFIIAGQSNAEGNVYLSGLEELKIAIPSGSGNLSSVQRDQARLAVASALGLWCDVDPNCAANPGGCPDVPFSHASADAVIDGLRNSAIDWRQINANYTHESVQITARNYFYSPVTIQSESGVDLNNDNCSLSPESTHLAGPNLDRYTGVELFPLGPGYGAYTGGEEVSFGPELGFGLGIGTVVSEPIILKVSMGGSSLQDHWRESGTLYQTLISETEKALSDYEATLGGLIWFQGFNDQFEGAYCEELPAFYEDNLTRLFSNIRTDLSNTDMPIVVVEARNGGRLPEIQEAQNRVVGLDEHTELIASKDLSDCFHYGSGSQILIGERAANAMKSLLEN